jgi:hypothetical protein
VKKPPAKPKPAAKPGVLIPGGPVMRVPPARHPARRAHPKPAAKPGVLIPGGPVMRVPPARHPARRAHPKPAAKPGVLIPGGPVLPAPPARPAARKKPKPRKLAAAGENCVLDACYALTGCRPDLGAEEGLLIPDALEALAALGLISDFDAADLEDDFCLVPGDLVDKRAANDDHDSDQSRRHGLILGVDLPGPHAVLATPDGWHSWGELYDPAGFPDAVVEEAWAVTL